MRLELGKNRTRAMTRIEGLVIAGCIAVLVGIGVPFCGKGKRERSERISCVNNIRQIGLAFKVWDYEVDERYPISAVGSLGYSNEMNVWEHFLTMSNELANPTIQMCPADKDRKDYVASVWSSSGLADPMSFSFQKNRATSYFIGLDASESNPSTVLIGDRNLAPTNRPFAGQLLRVTNQAMLQFDRRLHGFCGNIGLADGSVQQIDNGSFHTSKRGYNFTITNRLLFPVFP